MMQHLMRRPSEGHIIIFAAINFNYVQNTTMNIEQSYQGQLKAFNVTINLRISHNPLMPTVAVGVQLCARPG